MKNSLLEENLKYLKKVKYFKSTSHFRFQLVSEPQNILHFTSVSTNVFNGTAKEKENNVDFMSPCEVRSCMETIKLKNTEGYDRMPQRNLREGIDILASPFAKLFNKIYNKKRIPSQWLVSKIIPTFKKIDKTRIENHRPIANLCESSKILEKLILKRLESLQTELSTDYTGSFQHGFKKNRSTATTGYLLVYTLTAKIKHETRPVHVKEISLAQFFVQRLPSS